MTKIDHNLLFLRSENARMRLKDLSGKVKKSSQRLNYSIKVLEKEGIINDSYCVFDYSYFGIILFRVYFKGGYISENEREQIIKKLYDNPYIMSIIELTGEFDLVIEIGAPNPSRFNKELRKISELIPTLNNFKILVNIVTHIYPRNYLIQSQKRLEMDYHKIIGGDREIMAFKPQELKVMEQLLINPTARLTDLAEKSGMNVKTASGIIKDLKKKKIIRDYKYIIDTNKIGLSKYRVFFRLHNISPEREEELTKYMREAPEIVQANKTVGDWDLEIDIESFDSKRVRYIILEIREQYKDMIEDFNMIEYYKAYKIAYLPRYYFEESS